MTKIVRAPSNPIASGQRGSRRHRQVSGRERQVSMTQPNQAAAEARLMALADAYANAMEAGGHDAAHSHRNRLRVELAAALATQPAPAVSAELVAWLKDDGTDVMTDRRKREAEEHNGLPGKKIAAQYAIPLGVIAPPAVSAEPVACADDFDPEGSVGDLARHVGAWETKDGFVSFGSWMTVAAFYHHALARAAKQWKQMESARALYTHPAPQPQQSKVEAREVKNRLCIDGTLDRAFHAVVAERSPDAVRALLVELAHAAVDAALATHPKAEPADISRAEWIAAARRVYLACGDDERTADDLAAYLVDQQDWLGEEIGDPYEEALEEIEGRPPKAEPAGVPEGWQLVPKEPTTDMRNAYHAVTHGDAEMLGAAGSRWAAMLSAAPTPQGKEADRG